MKRFSTLAMAAQLALFGATGVAYAQDALDVKILAINDFHGNLLPPGTIKIRDPKDPSKTISVPAGGSEAMATLVKQLQSGNKNSIFVAAGDLISASPLLSALFHDEPTVESLSLMGLEASAVGNHEFDEGKVELLRMQNGGCHQKDGCAGPRPFTGAKYKYLAASTIDTATNKPLLPPYYIKEFEGIPVAFIGLTLKDTPGIVMPSGVEGLKFQDEAETVNALIPEIRARGVGTIVVLIHEGGFPTGDYNECPGISGPIVDIVKKLDKAVGLVISGHTHKAYNCRIDGRLVTSGDKFGSIVTNIDIKIDRKTRALIEAKADNVIVATETYAKDPEQTKLIEEYQKLAAPLANRVVGIIGASLTKEESPAGETTLGSVIADSQLAATAAERDGRAVVAFMNPGGVRTDLLKKDEGKVTYAGLFAVQPFANSLVTVDLTGAQIKTMLEQQWANQPKPRVLHVSKGFSYTWDNARPAGDRVLAESIKLNGKPIVLEESYRVTINNFLADGGDGFSVLKQAKNPLYGPFDIDAFAAYFAGNSPIEPVKLDRITRLN
ncbi:bifunctional metallophosphatase/5'-nucleotidase [Microvirga terricola]|uniref:Bifunctional metallophosphatase/5'-nucleotidase n=1 Tax=Microvirga terricola TaxID=2719797 RepID=A0ABX0VE88_9HYPH|nr:bifunctional metallophosphatase/5'-nucleotidase [Microvirga terricola]NIX77270.1 bifunctional metallophosphatase/5'-nucleotidase [Microvirga terricola]